MNKTQNIIAIDPDINKSGVCHLVTGSREVRLSSIEFPELMEYLKASHEILPDLLVLVEAGWLNESHWHLKKGESARLAAAKGNAVGRNHETGRKIVEVCKYYNIQVKEVRPLKKCWKGKDGKISHEELAYFIPGLPGKSNQETRDAALISWYYAGFPVRVKTSKYLTV